MKLTRKMIEKHDPCQDGLDWYVEHGTNDLLSTLLKVNKVNSGWASWLYTRLMTVNQRRELAIFAASKVLPIFESKHPNDARPRNAIKAAKIVLKNDTLENRKAAYAANAAANAAAYAAYAAANAAANAAAYAAYAVNAAYAAYAAANAAANARLKMQETIIRKAVKILDRK